MNIYDQHRKHTENVSAVAILHDGEHVANVTIRFPKDGAGRLYAYVHWIGTEMQRGHAGGYGYDKRSAALAAAARKRLDGWSKAGAPSNECMFWEYLADDNGRDWSDRLRAAGFTVCAVC